MTLTSDEGLRRLIAERDRAAKEGAAKLAAAWTTVAEYVQAMHAEGTTWVHIAEVLGVSKQYVSRVYGTRKGHAQ